MASKLARLAVKQAQIGAKIIEEFNKASRAAANNDMKTAKKAQKKAEYWKRRQAKVMREIQKLRDKR